MPEPLPSYRTDRSAISQGLSRVTTKAFPRCGKAHMTPRKRLSGSTGKAQANHKTPHHTDSQRLGITAKKTTYLQPENLMDIKKALSRSMLRIIMHLQPIRCIYIQKPQTTESEAHSNPNRAPVFIRVSHWCQTDWLLTISNMWLPIQARSTRQGEGNSAEDG